MDGHPYALHHHHHHSFYKVSMDLMSLYTAADLLSKAHEEMATGIVTSASQVMFSFRSKVCCQNDEPKPQYGIRGNQHWPRTKYYHNSKILSKKS